MTILVSLICATLVLLLFAGAFFLSKLVVEKTHRVHVLEDSYKEATEHILLQEQIIKDRDHEIEQLMYEAQQHGQRVERPRAWKPNDMLNSEARK